MVVQCSKCQARLRFDPAKLGSKPSRVRCAKCKNVFEIQPPSAASESPTPSPDQTVPEAAPRTMAPPPAPAPASPPTPAASPSPPEDDFGMDADKFLEDFELASGGESLGQISISGNSPPPAQPNTAAPPEPPPSSSEEMDPFAALENEAAANAPTAAPAPASPPPAAPVKATVAPPPKPPIPPKPAKSSSKKRKDERTNTPVPPPQKPKVPEKKRRSSPILEEISFGQWAVRSIVFFLISCMGLAAGFTALGVKLHPRELGILFKYGLRNASPGIHLVQHRAEVVEIPVNRRLLIVSGTLYNYSDQPRNGAKVTLQAYSEDGTTLATASKSCCEGDIPPYSEATFTNEVVVSENQVASYRVQLSNEGE